MRYIGSLNRIGYIMRYNHRIIYISSSLSGCAAHTVSLISAGPADAINALAQAAVLLNCSGQVLLQILCPLNFSCPLRCTCRQPRQDAICKRTSKSSASVLDAVQSRVLGCLTALHSWYVWHLLPLTLSHYAKNRCDTFHCLGHKAFGCSGSFSGGLHIAWAWAYSMPCLAAPFSGLKGYVAE